MSSGARTDIEAVQAANTALYDAIERGDLEAMADSWMDDRVSVVHPGWPVLNGRAEVLRSYALIMAGTEYIQFILTDVEVSVSGDTALVTCTENILSGGPREEDGSTGPLVGGVVAATNVFRRTHGGEWKVWAHHSSPIIVEEEDAEDSTGPDGPIEPPGPDDPLPPAPA
ncbi:nuclear transport factor 2 family protein [Streptomyces calidiresistens]